MEVFTLTPSSVIFRLEISRNNLGRDFSHFSTTELLTIRTYLLVKNEKKNLLNDENKSLY